MLSSYESGLRTRVVEVARSRLLILGVSAATSALFRLSGVPLPAAIFATILVWIVVAVTVLRLAHGTRDAVRLTRLQTIALLADIALVAAVHVQSGGGRWVGPVLSGIIVIAAMATLPQRRATMLTVMTIVVYACVVFGTSAGLLGSTISISSAPLLSLRQASALAAVGALALLLLASAQRVMVRAIQRSEERYRLVLDTATDMILTIDREGRVRSANDAVFAETGYTREELIGTSFGPFVHPDDLATTWAQFEATLRGEPRNFDTRYIRADGTVRWLAITNSPIRDGGATLGTFSIARDVTERRLSERRLAAQHRIARVLAASATFGEAAPALLDELIGSLGFEGACLWDAEALREGAGAAWARSTPCHGAGCSDERSALATRCQTLAREVLASGSMVWHPGAAADRADLSRWGAFAFPLVSGGSVRAVVVLLAPDRARLDPETVQLSEIVGGQIGQALEREALQRELAQAQTMQTMGRLVSGVAHELNNPLTAVLGFAEQLLDGEHSAEDREALAVIHQQARRARSIVRDLLTAVRRSEHRPNERTDLRAYLDKVEAALQPRVAELGASLVVVREGDLPSPAIDQVGIEQVITNLVVNAAQATGKGGTVTLVARARSGGCEIVVEDDGPGIAPEHLPRLFEPFFTTKAGEGTGLGLPVSKGIVERHGGTLTAANRGGGRGARMVIVLPCASAADDASSPAGDVTAPPRARRERPAPAVEGPTATRPLVLVVDDEDVIRHAVRRWFTRRGWDVVEASNGLAALEVLSTAATAGEPNVILCDLRMPGMTGMALHERLRVEYPGLLSRIIFSTGDVVSPESARFLAGTECPVLEKPFELDVLAATVERVLRTPLCA